jgi:hypothetical protein
MSEQTELQRLQNENRELKASVKRLTDALVRVNGEAVNVLRFEAELSHKDDER